MRNVGQISANNGQFITTHGCSGGKGRHPMPEYAVWQSMKARCYNPNSQRYRNYEGRGIAVCEEWRNSFESFLAYIGLRPSSKYTIDRIDNNGNYEPGNVRWSLPVIQANNRSSNRILVINKRSLTITEWALQTGIKESTIRERLRRGWNPEWAVSINPLRRSRSVGFGGR
jgi:hypothetical protein